uniref:Putative metalloprotease n=1 Tax=Ixodes ricinus TaxID=34613 RepID=A0A0K8RJD2_IXORI
MNPVAMAINIFMLSVTVSQFVLAPGFNLESRSEETKLNLAVQIVYDRKFENISKFRENGRYLDYFTTFLNIVELWFRDIKDLEIELTLHAATEGPENDIDHEPDEDEVSEETTTDEESVESREDENDEEDEEEEEEQGESEEIDKTTTPYKPCRNRSVTMKKFKYHVETQRNVYEGADIALFVTGHCVYPEVGSNEEWKGLPETGSICTNHSVGVVHDDGKTFSGTRSAAMQIALMLGAKKYSEQNCTETDPTDGYLLSNMTGGGRSGLSECSKTAIMKFLEDKKDQKCGKGTPTPAKHNAHLLAAQFYEAKQTDECRVYSSDAHNVTKCMPSEMSDLENQYQYTCKVTCCNKTDDTYQSYVTNSADGTQCDGSKICLSGNCINGTTSETLDAETNKNQ